VPEVIRCGHARGQCGDLPVLALTKARKDRRSLDDRRVVEMNVGAEQTPRRGPLRHERGDEQGGHPRAEMLEFAVVVDGGGRLDVVIEAAVLAR